MNMRKIVGYTLLIGSFITAIFGGIAIKKAYNEEAIKIEEEAWTKAWDDLGKRDSQ